MDYSLWSIDPTTSTDKEPISCCLFFKILLSIMFKIAESKKA